MKTIPSLIASSTIGIAAAGLALGKQEFPQLHKSESTLDDLNYDNDQLSSLSWRPGTSFTNFDSMNEYEYSPEFMHEFRTTSYSKPHRRPPLTHINRSKYALYRRPPSSLKIDRTSSHEGLPDEDRTRESISSRSSWIRRLSSRAGSHSQQGNSMSESPNTVPQCNQQQSTPRRLKKSPDSLPRNRLVKKITRLRAPSASDTLSRSGKKVLTIQRPATSHQRKLLLQRQHEGFSETVKDIHTFPSRKNSESPRWPHMWRQYFESRPISLSKVQNLENLNEIQSKQSNVCNRVVLDDMGIPTLVKPRMIFSSKDPGRFDKKCQACEINITNDKDIFDNSSPHVTMSRTSSGAESSTKLPHRSLSMHFTSPISRLSRPGSLRGLRSKAEGRKLERSASVLTPGIKGRSSISASGFKVERNPTFDQKNDQKNPITVINNLSPLPSLSRFSTLSIDLAHIGLSSSSSSSSSLSPPENPSTQIITKPHSCLNPKDITLPLSPNVHGNLTDVPRLPNTSRSNYFTFDVGDRASTLIGSDLDTKGFTSCDEDDTDFQSETVFDSMRSGATGIIQATKLPLEFIFDDSSFLIDDNSRLPRNDYHENLDYSGLHQQKITISEDEYTIEPLKETSLMLKTPHNTNFAKIKSPIYLDKYSPHISVVCLDKKREAHSYPIDMNNDFNDEEDWTKDEMGLESEESLKNELGTSIIEEKINTLVDLKSEIQKPCAAERPKTNVFDWSEPTSSEKLDERGISPRPRTAHVKHLLEGRCGRVLGRRGPTSLHIRSQSVPVAPDTDTSKITSKFGTWGLSSKAVPEDWDGDFEFDSVNSADMVGDESTMEHGGVQVPEAIKANQENIVGHVSQIREVCLLVEDLKRLRALGKAQGLLGGVFEPLWLEAEGIIALAAPAEDGDDREEEEKKGEKYHSACSLNINYKSSLSMRSNKNKPLQEDLSSDMVSRDENQKVSDRNMRAISICPDDESLQQTRIISPSQISNKNSIEGARKIMESIHQQRSASDPLLHKFVEGPGTKMPFDTTSLKDLVNRAAALSRTLGHAVRAANDLESISQSRPRDSSPAFTRMFTDPMLLPSSSSSPRTSRGSTSNVLIDKSSLQGLSQHMKMMTVT